jgi:hypothetical protein
MFDELDRLRDNLQLAGLLSYYARLGEPDISIWQDRLMQMEGVTSTELSRLHGQLIAFGWIEQNTGQVSVLRPGEVPHCYRITPSGQKALKRAFRAVDDEEEPAVIKMPEKSRRQMPRRKAG